MLPVTVDRLNLKGKRVFIRVDFHLPITQHGTSAQVSRRVSAATLGYKARRGSTVRRAMTSERMNEKGGKNML